MATDNALIKVTRLAGADLTAAQYKFVKLDASGEVVLAGDGEQAYGVLQNNPDSGETATIAISGITKCAADEAIAAGALVASSADGQATDTTGTGDVFLGFATTAAGAAGEVFSLDFRTYVGTSA